MNTGDALGDPVNYFGSDTDLYEKIRAPYPEQAIDWVVQQAHLKPGAVIADIGGGNGLLGHAFAKKGYRVIIVDPDTAMLSQAKSNTKDKPWASNVSTVKGYAHDTNIKPHSIDLIIAGNAAHWFGISKDASEIPKHWHTILKPEGKAAFFCMTPSLKSPMTRAVHDIMERNIEPYKYRPTHVLSEPKRTRSDAEIFLKPGFQAQHSEIPVSQGSMHT